MMVWKIIFLSKWVICRFHVNLPGCIKRNQPRHRRIALLPRDRGSIATRLPWYRGTTAVSPQRGTGSEEPHRFWQEQNAFEKQLTPNKHPNIHFKGHEGMSNVSPARSILLQSSGLKRWPQTEGFFQLGRGFGIAGWPERWGSPIGGKKRSLWWKKWCERGEKP